MNNIILDNSNIVIDKDSVCEIENKINELNIVLNDNASFILNDKRNISSSTLNLNITQKNNTNFTYNASIKVNKKYDLKIYIDMIGNNSKNSINIHNLNDSGRSNIIIDGKVNELTNDNELDEKIKALNINNGTSTVLPNMYINTKNVIANHSASISTIDSKYLFYLNSKGINNDLATKLIIDGFLNNN